MRISRLFFIIPDFFITQTIKCMMMYIYIQYILYIQIAMCVVWSTHELMAHNS